MNKENKFYTDFIYFYSNNVLFNFILSDNFYYCKFVTLPLLLTDYLGDEFI